MKQPRVSIIIPVFNGQNYLNQAVQSVLRQTYTDWELLLIDDGSTDESVPMAKRYAACHPEKIRCLEHPGHSNQGQLATRILGGQLARADVLALLDQDDIWDEYYLEKHLQLWDTVQSRQVCLSYGPGLYWFPDDRTGSRDFVQPMPPGAPKVYGPAELLESFFSSRYANTPCPSCTLLRRDVLSKVKHFEGLAKGSPCEDQYLWWYLAARWPVSVHCNIWTRYRRHNDSAYFQGTATAQQTGQAELKFLKAIQNDLSVESLA
jgi:glycosyltransferase involved in cell wall biosynthesis